MLCNAYKNDYDAHHYNAQQQQLLPVVVDACYQLPGLAGTELLTAARSSVRQQVFSQAQKTAAMTAARISAITFFIFAPP